MIEVKRIARGLALVGAGIAGASLLTAGVALASLGPSQFESSLRDWLDERHVYGPRTELVRSARRFDRADAVEDARRALASGDTRLIPVMGFAAVFPGVPWQRYDDHRRQYGAKPYLYGGCVIESDEEGMFRDAAYDYAERFNRALLAQLGGRSTIKR